MRKKHKSQYAHQGFLFIAVVLKCFNCSIINKVTSAFAPHFQKLWKVDFGRLDLRGMFYFCKS